MVQIPRLREWREARALTQVELAERAGLSSRSVAGYEAGAGARPPTVRKLAEALGVEVADLRGDSEYPLGQAPPSSIQPPLNGFEDERLLRYLRGWRAFAWKLERLWKQEPPKTSREIAPLFEVMTALMDEGVFEFSKATSLLEHTELMLFMEGLRDLNKIADDLQAGEEAEERRATFQVIQDQISA